MSENRSEFPVVPIIIGFALAIAILFAGLIKSGSDSALDRADLSRQAYDYAVRYVTDQLNSPSTADFRPYSEAKIIYDPPDTYTVIGQFDSENGFGTPIRKVYDVKIRAVDGRWTLISAVWMPRSAVQNSSY